MYRYPVSRGLFKERGYLRYRNYAAKSSVTCSQLVLLRRVLRVTHDSHHLSFYGTGVVAIGYVQGPKMSQNQSRAETA